MAINYHIEDTVRTTQANLNYLLPGPSIGRRFVSAGVEVNISTYGPFPMIIRDGRTIRDHFSFDWHASCLLDAPTCIANFHDITEFEPHYLGEVCQYVKNALGADLFISQGLMLRTSGAISKPFSETVTIDEKKP